MLAQKETSVLDVLNQEEARLFMEVFEASMRIKRREQLFNWLQGSLQYLLPHEVLICGMSADGGDDMRYESFISTRYVTPEHFMLATQGPGSLLAQVLMVWSSLQRPVIIAPGQPLGDFGLYHVLSSPSLLGALQATELNNVLVHGVVNHDGNPISLICFGRVPKQLGYRHAFLMELLAPLLHVVFIRVFGNRQQSGAEVKSFKSRAMALRLTGREVQILGQVYLGKSNQQIAQEMDISPLTVKNHVHNILRKLGVDNRALACDKALKLGLLGAKL